ncbi:hypothetical protein FOA52_010294 [Chlamydomonas sp. UWO 241]|nr:hypothetical protein FOA52_010294 [Chlamydomonas sp. UWO 241]
MGELIANLQRQVRALQLELEGRNAEISDLRVEADAAADMQSGDQQATKIIELSKKNRALNLAVESHKSKAAALQAQLAAGGGGGGGGGGPSPLAALDPDSVHGVARQLVEAAAEQADAAAREAAMWRERAQQQTNKMAQTEQRVFALEIESKKLTRALVREVGEDVPLARVLDEGSDWKGRREQVIALKEQVRQLRSSQGLFVPESRNEAAAKKAIGKIASNRSTEVDKLANELASARTELEATAFKCDAAVSRRKVLENELSAFKSTVTVVLEKSANDDALIAALRGEAAALRRGEAPPESNGGGRARGGGAPSGSTAGLDEETWQELVGLRQRVRQLEGQVRQLEGQVERQEQILLAVQRSSSSGAGGAEAAGSSGGQRAGGGGRGGRGGGANPLASPARAPPPTREEVAQQQAQRLLEIERARR